MRSESLQTSTFQYHERQPLFPFTTNQPKKSKHKKQTHDEQPAVHLDNVWYLKTPLDAVPVGAVELETDAEVAGDYDERGEGQVEAHYGDDEGEAIDLHPPPGQGAGQAEGFGAVPSPTDDGEQGPGECVQPDPRTQYLHCASADLLPYRNDTKHSPVHTRHIQWFYGLIESRIYTTALQVVHLCPKPPVVRIDQHEELVEQRDTR